MEERAARTAASILAAVLLTGLGGCGWGGEEDEEPTSDEGPLVVYSSTPRQGDYGPAGWSFVAGAEAALAQAGGRAGSFDIDHVALDSSLPGVAESPERVQANAERAADDPDAIAYIGDIDPATAAISLPVLNEAGLAQVGAAALPAGLTRPGSSAGAGEPERYYPAGTRHFVRIVPPEERIAAGIAALMQAEGCASTFLFARRGAAAGSRLRDMTAAAEAVGIAVAGQEELPVEPELPLDADTAAILSGEGGAPAPPCLALARVSGTQLAALAPALDPRAQAFGGEWLASQGSGTPPAGDVLAVTGASRPPAAASGSAAAFARRFRREHDRPPDPWAFYGYEAMSLVLDAIARAGDSGRRRAAVIRELFSTRGRRSVLGRYSVDRYGDRTRSTLGVWRAGGRFPRFERALRAGGSAG